ncbi:hydrogenase assembly chaperone hypC/hupF [Syntrophobotulus glycolicus DSM 8271]|uniref:Hydrogenase assembly chaperone hypC/hupF n=1 Tax=Syntrophobotulus glycolicus (strain DSM 8271 / FlGlyR) TaxID=645991 RepID=F0T201_SYNGF|nr:HypC/HybG/HupF family hydrogenase formation chaperone [Syntrophobotulus glycolicus]ADY56345.1 hydrogenase assembly chaperone hypC/hupF [Syntrophobotulus glycolicus DSM 8271]
MCVAIPGKVIETDGMTGKVDFNGNIVDIMLGAVDAKEGDYVLVHAGCAIETVQKDMAEEIISIFAELESITK